MSSISNLTTRREPPTRGDWRFPAQSHWRVRSTKLRVTAFRDYLACPYRFYLRHVEQLQTISDSLDELDGAGFGSLVHEVLRCFGNGASRDSTEATTICTALEQELDRCAAEWFGRNPLPAVLVQIEQLRWRLRAFAEQQAAWSEQGWRIEFVEASAAQDPGALFEVDGHPFWLTGRMDRIDVHRITGERVILDYKSSDAGQLPRDTHQTRDKWIDLQLPLYRHLAATLGIVGPVRLGYVLLPKDTSATGFVFADWSPEELTRADDCAARSCEISVGSISSLRPIRRHHSRRTLVRFAKMAYWTADPT